ncbi:hypothetical protein WJR50_18980 [Catalinimonas sp. 4WD22]|uniref:hypothetical protein n=1 Tax=Catalinimonas locisalis TaxID=3133978 RepID=UPI003101329B
MQQHEIPLLPGDYYHVYNRGINGETIFLKEENYRFFLEKYALFIDPVAETFAYCLLGNHFHLLIRVRAQESLEEYILTEKLKVNLGLHSMDKVVSRQFARFFSCYTQSFNKVYGRTGTLFEKPFHRKRVDSELYFTRLIYYIHANPVLHGFVNDLAAYPHSSFLSFTDERKTRLERDAVLSWFGGKQAYQDFHQQNLSLNKIQEWMIE